MSNPTALIVDDEPDILELLDITLTRMGINPTRAGTIDEAHTLLSQQSFDLCLTDMQLPDGNGIDLVGHIQAHYPETPVAVITAFGSMEAAIDSLKAGAFDFVNKPVELPRLRDLIQQALKLTPEQQTKIPEQATRLLGKSACMEQLQQQIQKVSRSQAPVYISGESGSGKELAAQLIHELGPRNDQPFVPVNCGAIPSELMESEFFGHKKGSFTGATSDKEGLFQSANGGTLFLDEVADLPLHMQVKLLRAIQEKAVRAIGSEQELSVDVRILCATHKDLAAEVEAGHFRQDMFYRLNVIELKVPPLRERSDDIPLLTKHLLKRMTAQSNGTLPDVDKEAMKALKKYSFPGNVRELENILERAYTLCEDNRIELSDLQLNNEAGNSFSPAQAAETPVDSLDDYLEDIERKAIMQALEDTRWNRTAAAEKLGITFRQMRHRLKKLGIE